MPDPTSPLEHVTLNVSGVPGAREFYRAVMGAIGLAETEDEQGRAAYGGRGGFGIYEAGAQFFHRTHIAFAASSRASVDAFHAAAIAAGGTSLSAPRPRPESDARFYSAYVTDPGGNVLEILFRSPVPLEVE
jgi:catechol 2,3-dioxygenase-like lactoylglutathione lyase family enzyme